MLITFAIQESRISELRRELKAAETPIIPANVTSAPSASAEAPAAPARTKGRSETVAEAPAKEPAAETSKILNEAQQKAFQDYQKQAEEMQLMGLKMAEQVMGGKKEQGQ